MKKFRIKPEYITSCTVSWRQVNEYNDIITGTLSNVDHPAFTSLRDHLGQCGIIRINRQSWNADVVLEDFMLNEREFLVGQRFPSGGALGVELKVAERNKPTQHLSEDLFNV